MEKASLNVPGISCEHCETAIKGAVSKIKGVSNVIVDIKGKHVNVEYDSGLTSLDAVKSAIEDQGYDVA